MKRRNAAIHVVVVVVAATTGEIAVQVAIETGTGIVVTKC